MRNTKNENLNIQVKDQGENQVFSFSLPKGTLSAEHIESFLDFVDKNEAPRVSKSLLSIYFTAINDQYFKMDSDEKFHLESVLSLLSDLSCSCKGVKS